MTTDRIRLQIRPLQLLVPALTGLGVAALLGLRLSMPLTDLLCVGVLMSMCLTCLTLGYLLVRRDLILIWSPITWFLAASGVYFGFGPLILFLGDALSVSYLQALWHVTTKDVLRVTLLNAIGVMVVWWVWSIKTRRVVANTAMASLGRRPVPVALIVVFYLIGLPARVIGTLYWFNMVAFTAPGSLNWVGNFSSAGLVLLTIATFQRRGGWWLIWGFMASLEVLFALTTFSKQAIVASILPCLVGYLLYRPELRVVRWIAVALVLTYMASVPFVTYARKAGLGGKSMQNRLSLASSYLNVEEQQEPSEERQNWWSRLNYANPQAFAMTEYDEDRPGPSFRLAAIAWIPRIVWPNKPIIESGYDFYTRLTGERNVSFGIGLFAEAYWNGGWLYVILASLGVGWVFGTVTVQIVRELGAGNAWVLPIALLWMRNGLRVDGWFHTEIVGPAAFTLLYFALLRFWQPAPGSSRRRLLTSRTGAKRSLKPVNRPASGQQPT